MKFVVLCFSLFWPVATDAFYPTLLALSQGYLQSLNRDRPDYSSGGATVMQPLSEFSAQDTHAQTAGNGYLSALEQNRVAFPTLMTSTQSSIDDFKTRAFGEPSAAAAGSYLDSLSAKNLYVVRDTFLVPQRGANAGGYLEALSAASVSAGTGSDLDADAEANAFVTPHRHADGSGYLDALSAASPSQGSSFGGFHGSGSYLEVISAPSSPLTTDTELSNDDDLNEPEDEAAKTAESVEHSVTVTISETPVASPSDAEDTGTNDIDSSSASTTAPGTSYLDMLQSKTKSRAVIASGGGGGMSVGNAYLARLSGISTSELKPRSGGAVVGNNYIESLSKARAKDDDLLQKIKDNGLAGIISYAFWEVGFWTISIPFCLFAYKGLTGHWPDITDSDDLSTLGAEAFAFVNFARFAVPMRIGLALSTTPWIEENIVERIKKND